MTSNDLLGIENPNYRHFAESLDNDLLGPSPKPRQLLTAYKTGLFHGAVIDTERAPWYVRNAAKYDRDAIKERRGKKPMLFEESKPYEKIRGSGEGKLCTPWHHYLRVGGPKAMRGAQVTGDCVSWAIRVAIEIARVWRIMEGDWNAFVERQASCGIYTGRGHTGQGASPWRCSEYAVAMGILLERQYLDGKYDFRDYDDYVRWGMRRGRDGMPRDLLDITKPYGSKECFEIDGISGLRDALHSGWGVHSGSDIGVDDTGGPISRLRGSWSHDMGVVGFDDTRKHFDDTIVFWDQSWGCHDDQTEILTENGWRSFEDLLPGEKVASMDPVSHDLRYEEPTQYHRYPYSSHLYHYSGRGFDVAVTPNHRMYYTTKGEFEKPIKRWIIGEAQNISQKYIGLKKNSRWNGVTLPYGDDELSFIGWYIAEGSTVDRIKVTSAGNDHRERSVSIAQVKPHVRQKMAPVMSRLGLTEIEKGFVAYGETARRLCDLADQCGHSAESKCIPPWIYSGTVHQLRVVYEALMDGDGNRGRTATSQTETYYTGSSRLAGDFQRLLLHLGWSGDCRVYDRRGRVSSGGVASRLVEHQIGVRKVSNEICPRDGISPMLLPYRGNVYCVTVPSGLIYTRRNGKPIWGGNSWNRVTNIPDEWKPWGEGMFALSSRDTMRAIRDGGTIAFKKVKGLPAEPIDNMVL